MSRELISRSPDLQRLRDDGYDVSVIAGYLVVREVPYVDSSRCVRRGVLVSSLALAGDVAAKPDTHVIYFAGDFPCTAEGNPIDQIRHATAETAIADGLVVNHSFSSKPVGGYGDYYEKMATYAAIVGGPARVLDASATAKVYPVILDDDDQSPFCYIDTASSRAGITRISSKLNQAVVSIVGLGGTGAYILDLISKTPIAQIRLFDDDNFRQHNAFRAPGAASIDELRQGKTKAEHFRDVYSKLHRGISAHGFVDDDSIGQLLESDFVFICVDRADARRSVIAALESRNVPFVDTGIGVQAVGDMLTGAVRVTSGSEDPGQRMAERHRIPLDSVEEDADYATNIQIADLNALNAALAVIRWKKSLGFYADLEQERHCEYAIDGNRMFNGDYA